MIQRTTAREKIIITEKMTMIKIELLMGVKNRFECAKNLQAKG